MQPLHEIAFAITADARSQDVILHPAADVDRIDLDEPVVANRRGSVGVGFDQAESVEHKAARSGRGQFTRGEGHA